MSDPSITVVLIEDEKQIRRFVRASLEGEGIVVHDAPTGKQGLVEAATRKPDLVIASDGADTISVFRNTSVAGDASPSFAPHVGFATGGAPWFLGIGDVLGHAGRELDPGCRLVVGLDQSRSSADHLA